MSQQGFQASLLQELNSVLAGWPWHVVSAVQPASGSFKASGLNVPSLPSEIHGIFVLADMRCKQVALDLVTQSRSANDQLPVIVIVLNSLTSELDVNMMLDAQHAFQEASADDVTPLLGYSPELLRLTIEMSVQRARRRDAELQTIQQWVEEKQKLEQPAQVNMFWSCAHRIFAGFPKVDQKCSAGAFGSMLKEQVDSILLTEELGQGAFGTVYLGIDQDTGRQEAVKVFDKSSLNTLHKVCNVWREISLLQKLEHPSIVKIHGVIHARYHIFLRMELGGQLNLSEHMEQHEGRLGMPEALAIGAQVSAGLAHCHRCSIAHRDVKHGNIVIGEQAKVIDFGLSVEVGTHGTEQRCGTMPFCPPEMLRGICDGALAVGEGARDGRLLDPRAADVWALGVVNLEMVGGLGLMRELMRWPKDVDPGEERARELEGMLGGEEDALARALVGFAGTLGRWGQGRVKPLHILRSGDFARLLATMLSVDTPRRCGMEAVAREMHAQCMAASPRSCDQDLRRAERLPAALFNSDPQPPTGPKAPVRSRRLLSRG